MDSEVSQSFMHSDLIQALNTSSQLAMSSDSIASNIDRYTLQFSITVIMLCIDSTLPNKCEFTFF